MANPPLPRAIADFAARVEKFTGVSPTVTREDFSRWLVELRTDRVYANSRWRTDRLKGRPVVDGDGVLEVDGQSRKAVGLRALGDIVRHPDGMPATLPPMAKEFGPERLPTLVGTIYEMLVDKLASHADIEVRVGSGRVRHEIDLAIDLAEDTGLRLAFRKAGNGTWRMCERHLLVVVDGINRAHEVQGGGAEAAVEVLLAAKNRPPVPTTIGSPEPAKAVNSVQVRRSVVMRN